MKKIIGEYNVIPNVFTEFKNNALILSTSNNVKLHGIVINRMQVIFTTSDISKIYVLGSAEVSIKSNIKSKH